MRRPGSSSLAAATTCSSIVRPHTTCSTFGVRVFIRVPSPAARMMTAAGPLPLTRLGSSVSVQARGGEMRPPGHRRVGPRRLAGGAVPRRFTLPTSAGYRPVAAVRLAWEHLPQNSEPPWVARRPLSDRIRRPDDQRKPVRTGETPWAAPGRGFEPRFRAPKALVLPIRRPGNVNRHTLYRRPSPGRGCRWHARWLARGTRPRGYRGALAGRAPRRTR